MTAERSRWLATSMVATTLVAVILFHFSCATEAQRAYSQGLVPSEPRVRVLLSKYAGARAATLDVGSEFEVRTLAGQRLGRAPARTGIAIASARGGQALRIGDATFPHASVEIVPARDGALTLGGTSYRGTLVVRTKGDAIDLVNALPMEDYLAGVLGAEMPLAWSEEALGAQAVAARTYALYEIAHARRDGFDVHDTEASQVYLGMSRDTDKARRVLDATRGQYLVFEGKLIKTYFSSTCGGHTASAAAVFGGGGIEPLSGSPCGACDASKYHRWQAEFPAATIASKLAAAGVALRGDLRSIEPVNPGPGGHASEVKLVTSAETKKIAASKFRAALGYSELRSTAFTATKAGDGFRIEGRGWGHGVGLCQYGAEGLARRGKKTREIVLIYYPGARFETYR